LYLESLKKEVLKYIRKIRFIIFLKRLLYKERETRAMNEENWSKIAWDYKPTE
jgi:hypothetical protein